MHFLIIFPAVLIGLASARPHPQGGSAGVLGFCHTGIPGCSFSSLYDCTNRGGNTQYYCVTKCGCENQRSVKNPPPLTEPSPAPLPLVKSNGKDDSSPENVSSNEPDTSPEETSPEETAPEENAPETTAEEPAPEENTPETTTGETAPEEASEESTPEETPEESPEETPEESASEEASEKS